MLEACRSRCGWCGLLQKSLDFSELHTCIEDQLNPVPDEVSVCWDGAAVHQAHSTHGPIGCRHEEWANQEGAGRAQVANQRGHGGGGGPLIRSEPRGGEQGAGAHDGWAG